MLDMTNEHLNIQLAKLMGNVKMDVTTVFYGQIPQYCTDPSASLEVQAAACEVDASLWSRNMLVVRGMSTKMACEIRHLALPVVAQLCNASPRERAEAAYMTLSSWVQHTKEEKQS
ncbi:hypothetical protein JOD82_001822 [Paenibacillus sp. 1182]|uniref:hypothetical protein n=1 Tax=Paenibacillus sp. 1182 TaxID=2806565 RepID=UPI001AE55FED|nr:hypothetical protein [Paenibacillus sp. 1182]MBP1308802.1 hypothetical protein [Paenibacillus sp. 1182]